MKIGIQKCGNDVEIPKYQHEGDAGMDLKVNNFKKLFYPVMVENQGWAESEDNLKDDLDEIELHPGCRVLIGTGVKIELPNNFELQIRSRSGLSLKHGIVVVNSPGTIDSNFSGEIGVILINHSVIPYTIKKGDRVAQGVLSKVGNIEWVEKEKLNDTNRGESGFGSSGK